MLKTNASSTAPARPPKKTQRLRGGIEDHLATARFVGGIGFIRSWRAFRRRLSHHEPLPVRILKVSTTQRGGSTRAPPLHGEAAWEKRAKASPVPKEQTAFCCGTRPGDQIPIACAAGAAF